MTVDGVTYKTIVRCWFTRCFYDQPRPSLKPRQSTGNGPYIDVRVMVAKIKNPDLNDDDHWRDLNINFSALDDGTRLTLFKFYFNRFGSQGANLTRMSMQDEVSMDLLAISVYSRIALVNLRHRLFHGRWRSKLAQSKNKMSLALVLLATPTSNLTSASCKRAFQIEITRWLVRTSKSRNPVVNEILAAWICSGGGLISLFIFNCASLRCLVCMK